jgi:hypothetical protein
VVLVLCQQQIKHTKQHALLFVVVDVVVVDVWAVVTVMWGVGAGVDPPGEAGGGAGGVVQG